MNVAMTVLANAAVFRLSGAHTPRDSGALQADVERILRQGYRKVVLNLEEVTNMGAAGLGALVKIHGTVRTFKGRLTLSAVPYRVRYLLTATNTAPFFETVAADAEALTADARTGIDDKVA